MGIAGIVLAAGSSARMGRNKMLLEFGGESLLRRAARRAVAAGLDPVLAVIGHEAERAIAELAGLPVRAVLNPAHAQGINTSLSAGVAALPGDAEAAVVVLADMPLAGPAQIRGVVARWRETRAPAVASRYGDAVAPPTLYARELFPALQGGVGEGRGREVVRAQGSRAAFVDWPRPALEDVDVPEDIERVRAQVRTEEEHMPGDLEDVLEQAAAWSDARLGVAIATVTSTWGSALRPTGSQLAVNEQGAFAGSVSGGCIEAAVVQEALDAIRDGKPRRLRYGVSNEQAWELGMACGGTIEVYVEKLA